MTYRTHIAFALTSAVPFCEYQYGLVGLEAIMFLGATSIGALAPDLDEEGSYLSNKLPIFPLIFKLFNVKHRGITHRAISILFLFLILCVIGSIDKNLEFSYPIYIGFIFGYLFHLFGDMLTKGGINQFFYPFSNSRGVLLPRKFRFYTFSNTETIVFLLLCCVVATEYMFFLGIINV
ncbi:metal-dependent hydrolase [Sulfurimonas sp.]|uniref:metal-dependent hydrolase n=1 Tax=Sulfurimonas sp. TaxID=2022749 RepID=UPI0025DADD96|nr:metal-dependent hydrolase [Sulfurimonas sp.]